MEPHARTLTPRRPRMVTEPCTYACIEAGNTCGRASKNRTDAVTTLTAKTATIRTKYNMPLLQCGEDTCEPGNPIVAHYQNDPLLYK